MGAAYFYHLTRHPVDVTLAMLLSKAREAGWRVAVKGTDMDQLRWLDERLWLGPQDHFLPHAMAGGPHDSAQPVLLGTSEQAPNRPHCVICVDGATIEAKDVNALERVCIVFDGNDERALDVARSQWKSLKEAGVSAQYWSQSDGRWEKKAQT